MVVAPPAPTPDDLKALKILRAAADERVKYIRTRAEKWIPGLTAIVGLISVALIIKGPDSFAKLTGRTAIQFKGWFPDSWVIDTKDLVAALIGIAFVSLLVSTFCAYSAAFGSALSPDTLDENPIFTLALRYAAWRETAEGKARRRLRVAVSGAILASVLLALSIWIAIYSPMNAQDAGSVCVFRGTDLVVKVPAPISLEVLPEGTRVEVC
jgi:hypothetical protein